MAPSNIVQTAAGYKQAPNAAALLPAAEPAPASLYNARPNPDAAAKAFIAQLDRSKLSTAPQFVDSLQATTVAPSATFNLLDFPEKEALSSPEGGMLWDCTHDELFNVPVYHVRQVISMDSSVAAVPAVLRSLFAAEAFADAADAEALPGMLRVETHSYVTADLETLYECVTALVEGDRAAGGCQWELVADPAVDDASLLLLTKTPEAADAVPRAFRLQSTRGLLGMGARIVLYRLLAAELPAFRPLSAARPAVAQGTAAAHALAFPTLVLGLPASAESPPVVPWTASVLKLSVGGRVALDNATRVVQIDAAGAAAFSGVFLPDAQLVALHHQGQNVLFEATDFKRGEPIYRAVADPNFGDHMELISEFKEQKSQLESKLHAYAQSHPEARQLLSDWLASVLHERPSDVFAFTRRYFSTDVELGLEPTPTRGSSAAGAEAAAEPSAVTREAASRQSSASVRGGSALQRRPGSGQRGVSDERPMSGGSTLRGGPQVPTAVSLNEGSTALPFRGALPRDSALGPSAEAAGFGKGSTAPGRRFGGLSAVRSGSAGRKGQPRLGAPGLSDAGESES